MIYCPLIVFKFPKGMTPKDNCVHYEKNNGCSFWKSKTKKCEAEMRDEN